MNAADTYAAPRHGWTCFHCGAHFGPNDKGIELARQHFGETPDETPFCIEVLEQLRNAGAAAATVKEIRRLRVELIQAYAQRERADEVADGLQGSLNEIARRLKVASAYDAYDKYHVMEGRALCAESILGKLEAEHPGVVMAARKSVCGPGTYYPYPPALAVANLRANAGQEKPHDAQP